MAVTVTKDTGTSGIQREVYDVVSDDDADTDVTITHTLGKTPKSLKQWALTVFWYVSTWIETSRSSTVVGMRKAAAVGSGDAAKQLRVEIAKPHSIFD